MAAGVELLLLLFLMSSQTRCRRSTARRSPAQTYCRLRMLRLTISMKKPVWAWMCAMSCRSVGSEKPGCLLADQNELE